MQLSEAIWFPSGRSPDPQTRALPPCLELPNLTVLPFTKVKTICLEDINSSQTPWQNICECLMVRGGWQKWWHHSNRQQQTSCGHFCSAEHRRQRGTERKGSMCSPQRNTVRYPHSCPSLGHIPPPRPLFVAKHLGMLNGEGHSLSEASIQIQQVVWKSLFSVITLHVQVKKYLLLF